MFKKGSFYSLIQVAVFFLLSSLVVLVPIKAQASLFPSPKTPTLPGTLPNRGQPPPPPPAATPANTGANGSISTNTSGSNATTKDSDDDSIVGQIKQLLKARDAAAKEDGLAAANGTESDGATGNTSTDTAQKENKDAKVDADTATNDTNANDNYRSPSDSYNIY